MRRLGEGISRLQAGEEVKLYSDAAKQRFLALYQECSSNAAMLYGLTYEQLRQALGDDAPVDLLKLLIPLVAEQAQQEAHQQVMLELREQQEALAAQRAAAQLEQLQQLQERQWTQGGGPSTMPSPW